MRTVAQVEGEVIAHQLLQSVLGGLQACQVQGEPQFCRADLLCGASHLLLENFPVGGLLHASRA